MPSTNSDARSLVPNPDFKEFVGYLIAHHVEFVIVGAYALAVHGAPRFTNDLDIFVRPTLENARRLQAVLRHIGRWKPEFTVEEFARPDTILSLGDAPVRVDLLTSLS